MPEQRLNVTKDIQGKVYEMYTKGFEQKEIAKLLDLQPKVVSHYFILFTATFTERYLVREKQLQAIEDRLFKLLETAPFSSECYNLEKIYSQYLLVK